MGHGISVDLPIFLGQKHKDILTYPLWLYDNPSKARNKVLWWADYARFCDLSFWKLHLKKPIYCTCKIICIIPLITNTESNVSDISPVMDGCYQVHFLPILWRYLIIKTTSMVRFRDLTFIIGGGWTVWYPRIFSRHPLHKPWNVHRPSQIVQSFW